LLHEKGVLLESSSEDFALGDDAVESFIGRVGAIEKLRVEGVESLGPCLDHNVKIIVEAVLSRQDLRRDASVFDNGNSIGDQWVDCVFECAEGVAVGLEEGDTFEGWLGQYICCCTLRVFGDDLPEFHTGAAASAKPRPTRSKANFRPADMSLIGAKVEANFPIVVVTDVSALLIAS